MASRMMDSFVMRIERITAQAVNRGIHEAHSRSPSSVPVTIPDVYIRTQCSCTYNYNRGVCDRHYENSGLAFLGLTKTVFLRSSARRFLYLFGTRCDDSYTYLELDATIHILIWNSVRRFVYLCRAHPCYLYMSSRTLKEGRGHRLLLFIHVVENAKRRPGVIYECYRCMSSRTPKKAGAMN